jgi:hypothetical protein
LLLACWTSFVAAPLSAWAQGSAAESPGITLECQNCQPGRAPVRLQPGRKVQLYGPPGTAPIRGEVVAGGDTITLKAYGQPRKVPAAEVKGVGVRRPLLWLKLLGLHAGYLPYLLIAGIILAFGGAATVTAVLVLAVPYLLVLAILLATMDKYYSIGPWTIRRPKP